MKRYSFFIPAVLSALLCLTFFSCRHNLIPEPTIDTNASKNPADYADAILPPSELTATHGGYRNITLEWSPVENAVRYQIYYAKTPFDAFELYAETADAATTYEIEAPAGSTYYFFVKAVNYYETVSAESVKTTGSSLAVPIITNITASEDAQTVVIEWWMDNCNAETYQTNTLFTIKAYDSNKKEISGAERTEAGNKRSTSISGLSPNTKYYFTVQAEITGLEEEQKPEISDKTSKETAHSIIPASVTDFSASKGTTKNYIELTWTLPDGADYLDNFTNTYKLNPIFFNILRKDLSDESSDYETIATIGTEGIGTHYLPIDYTFNCKNQSTSSENISINVPPSASSLELYENYKPGSSISFKDKNSILKGNHYSYKIITYTDDTLKKYTPIDSDKILSTGWDFPAATFTAIDHKNLNADDPNHIDSYDISFKLTFNAYDVQYEYELYETQTPLDNSDPIISTPIVFNSISALNAYRKTINTTDLINGKPTQGKYNYKITIKCENESITEESLRVIQVTDNNSESPLTSFVIRDGYKDKFIAIWNYDENFSYEIEEYKYENDNSTDYVKSTPFLKSTTLSATDIFEGLAVVNIPAQSGDISSFVISAYSKNNGKWCGSITLDEKMHTLGTAKIKMESPKYDRIIITWPKVQMADHDKYAVSAKYVGETTELSTETNTEIIEEEDNIRCIISTPNGYDNPTISGKTISLSVLSTNDKEDITEGSCSVMTLGPAAINYSLNEIPEKEFIRLKWNKIPDISNYLIYRVIYSDKTKTEIAATDTLIVSDNNIISEATGQSTENRSIITSTSDQDGNITYQLTDTQYDAEEIFGYQLHQERIQWGLPFGYLILPLENTGSKSDFTFNDNSLTLKNESKVNYGTLTNKTTSTIGYGLNVHAAKSESATKIKIEWDKPNSIPDMKPTIYRMPFNKTPNWDYGNVWEKIKTISSSANSFEDEINNEDSHKAFMYAVEYESGANSNLVRSYRNKIAENDTSESYNFPAGVAEPSNKGYLFAIKDFRAESVESEITKTDYFEESVRWDPTWDFEERALVPLKFTVDIQNKNLSSTKDWITLADVTIDSDGKFSIMPVALDSKWDTTVTETPARNGIDVKPESLTAAIENIQNASEADKDTKTKELQKLETTGLLNVLRDTRHYYSLNITGTGTPDRQAANNSIYSYRQVTEKELAKCVSVIIADALYQASIPTEEGASAAGTTYNCMGDQGIFSITHVGWHNSCEWGFNNLDYRHVFRGSTPVDHALGKDTHCYSDITLNAGSAFKDTYVTFISSGSHYCIKENKLYYLPDLKITVSSSYGLKSYNCVINFSAGKEDTTEYSLSIKKDGITIVSISKNYDDFIKYFPYWFDNEISATKITEYYSSCPLYQSPWWN